MEKYNEKKLCIADSSFSYDLWGARYGADKINSQRPGLNATK